MVSDIDKIEAQYNEHPYPEPIQNFPELIEQGYIQGSCLKNIWQRLFPEKKYSENLNVLIAGCGTNQAVYHALRYPNSKHYAIDVSEASVSHVSKMIEKYNIKNLIIEKKDILELSTENKFDYVVSTGVIHHTQNPQYSLNRLVEVTKDDGALFIMVYSSYLRMGIYFLQDAFRYLNLKSDKTDIAIAQRLIELLPKNHYVHNYLEVIKNNTNNSSKDLNFDAGIVDTFFNARDRAYNINELKNLINESGSYFQNWYDNEFYYKKLFDFSRSEKLYKSYNSLNNWELSDFSQKIRPNSGKFEFILRKKKKFENKFFNIEELTPPLVVRQIPFKKLGANNINNKLDISKDIENIILMNLNDSLEVILEKSNNLISKKYPSEKLSFIDLRNIIHNYWKIGFLSLAEY